jgi:isocitrate dehydrogenase
MQKRKNSQQSAYALAEVRSKIAGRQVLIRSDVLKEAWRDFGWGYSEILDAYTKLKPKDFYKTEKSLFVTDVSLDFYKARINGEDIYTHFYIAKTENKLVINSFHKLIL